MKNSLLSIYDSFNSSDYVAVCVGIEDYMHLPVLEGASESASKIFNTLTKSENGICNSHKSRLLLNPSYGEFHRFLESYTYFLKPTDHLIIYFQGNIDLVNNKIVLCLRDSSFLPDGSINPFTIQGWQSFFQLAGVSRVKSVSFVFNVQNVNSIDNSVKGFSASLRKSIKLGLPIPKNIPWGIVAGCSSSDFKNNNLFFNTINNVIISPPKYVSTSPFIPFKSIVGTVKKDRKIKTGKSLDVFTSLHGKEDVIFCRNPRVKVRVERFSANYINILRAFAQLPAGEYSPYDILAEISPSAWTVVNKLSYEPWQLIASGKNHTKRITKKGRSFLKGNVSIPLFIKRTSDNWESNGTETITIDYFKELERQKKEDMKNLNRQIELFP